MSLRLTILLGIFLTLAHLHQSGAAVQTLTRDKGSSGSNKRIPCTVTNEQFRRWELPNGSKVKTTDKSQRPHVEQDGAKYFLVINDIKSSDGGKYTCIGSKGRATFELEIQFKIDQSNIKDQKLFLQKEGVIRINASGYPKPTYTWFKDGDVITPSGRYSILGDGSLKINKVEKTDEGQYKCKVTQFQGLDSDTAEVDVKVFDPARITQAPKAELRPSKGYNVTMKCVASGYPAPTYVWRNQGGSQITTHGRTRVKNGELTIVGVLSLDKGAYTCEASSGDGTVDKATSTIVEVYEPPTITLKPSLPEIVKNLKESVTVECTAGGTPPVQVTWKKEGVRLDRQKGSAGKSVLTLENVRLSDVATYTCQASNNARDVNGNLIVVEKSVQLRVRSKPEINRKASPGIVYSFVGNQDPVNIRCAFDGYPSPEVKIYLKKKKVANGTGTATYKLRTKESKAFTTYWCNAKNIYGSVNHTVKLDYAKPPSAVLGLTASDVTCDAVKIEWQEPEKDGGMPVRYYVVEYLESRRNVESSTTEYRIGDLKPETDYRFTVWPRNSAQKGPEEEVSVETKKFCKPSRPAILEPLTELLEDTTFVLKWRRPELDGGDPDISYKIRYAPVAKPDETVEKKELETSGRQITLSNLEPGTKYDVEVVAINKGGESEPATRQYQVSRVAARSSSHTAAGSVFAVLAVSLPLLMM